jgi:predicted RNA-binding Zn ribbon-like protein
VSDAGTADLPSGPATARFDLEAAPAPLGFVQDLLNTRGALRSGIPDLLASVTAADRWAQQALGWIDISHSGGLCRDEKDLRALVAYREHLRSRLIGVARQPSTQTASLEDVPVLLTPDDEGWALKPAQKGVGLVIGIAAIAAYESGCNGTWERLKECANPQCHSVFFDRSRNNTRVWHSLSKCGNAINLRNSRQRRASTDTR